MEQVLDGIDIDHAFRLSLPSTFDTEITPSVYWMFGFAGFYSYYLMHNVFERRIKRVMDLKFSNEINEVKNLICNELQSIDDITRVVMDYANIESSKPTWKRMNFFGGLYQRIIIIDLNAETTTDLLCGEAPMLFFLTPLDPTLR